MQNNFAVLITKHQSLKTCQYFILYLLVIFLWICQVQLSINLHNLLRLRLQKNLLTCFCSASISECYGQISQKTVKSERWDSHKKCAHFCLLRFYKYVTLSQGNVSTLKTTPNEVTEPPSLHSRQTRASWVSDSDEASASLLSEGSWNRKPLSLSARICLLS